MQAEERTESTVTHRKRKETATDEDKDSDDTEENLEEDEENETSKSQVETKEDPPKLRLQEDFTTWGTVKYRFYLFRYYHYYYADKLDKFLAAGCLWIMRMYFKFLGLVENAEQSNDE